MKALIFLNLIFSLTMIFVHGSGRAKSRKNIPALTEGMDVGELYNGAKDEVISHFNLFDNVNNSKKEYHLGSESKKIQAEQTLKDRMTNLDIKAELKLSFLAGLVEVSGSAKYIHEEKATKEHERVTFIFKRQSKKVSINGNTANVSIPMCDRKKEATHVITEVVYGSNAFLSFDKKVDDFSKKIEIAGSLAASVKAASLSVDGHVTIDSNEFTKEFLETITFTYHGNIENIQSPRNYKEAIVAIQAIEKNAQIMADEGREPVISYSIAPLSDFCGGEAKILNGISKRNVRKVEKIVLEFEEMDQYLRKLTQFEFSKRFYKYGEMLEELQRRYGNFQTEIKEELFEILPQIRKSTSQMSKLIDLIKKYDNSPFRKSALKKLLGTRQKEIETVEYIIFHKDLPNEVIVDFSDKGASNICTIGSNYVVEFILNILPKNSSNLGRLYEENRWPDESNKWFNDRTQVHGLRPLTQKFIPFVKENKDQSICFIVSLSTLRDEETHNVQLMQNGMVLTRNFDPPGMVKMMYDKEIEETWIRLNIKYEPVTNLEVASEQSSQAEPSFSNHEASEPNFEPPYLKGVMEIRYKKAVNDEDNWESKEYPLKHYQEEIDVTIPALEPNTLYDIESKIAIHMNDDVKIGHGPKSQHYVTTKNRPLIQLNVNVYLSRSWRRKFSNAQDKAKEVLDHASKIFVDNSLDRKIRLRPSYIELDYDSVITSGGLEGFGKAIPRKYLETGTLHMLLTADTNSDLLGLAWQNSICGKANRRASGMVRWNSNTIETAKNFVHQAAHTLGINHDFADNRGTRNWTCGPEKWKGGGQIMNYGKPISDTWSSCSNYDFKDYYEQIVKSEGIFCLNSVN